MKDWSSSSSRWATTATTPTAPFGKEVTCENVISPTQKQEAGADQAAGRRSGAGPDQQRLAQAGGGGAGSAGRAAFLRAGGRGIGPVAADVLQPGDPRF